MVRFGVPGQNVDSLSYADSRLSTVPVVHAPRRPTVNDKKFPMWCEWRTNKDSQLPVTEGEFWKLIRFESNGDATWVQVDIGGAGPGVDDLRDQVNVQVTPDASGNIDIDGAVVNNAANPSGIPLETVADPGTNTLDMQIQVSTARTGAPGDKNDAGICSFDDTAFAVDGEGYVTLVGGAGPAVDSIDIDFNTGPGTDPVVPSGAGVIQIFGNTVTNATNAASPVATHSRAANQFHIDVQLGAAVAATPADPEDAGLLSMDNSHFSVDANGFTKLLYPYGPQKGYANLGCSYSAGTFTIHAADGSALSATNPAYVTVQSKGTPGQLVTISVTANQDFIDDAGASEIIDNLFGVTTSIAYGQDMPFFIYGVSNDDEDAIAFGITRSPIQQSSPGAAAIGTPSSATADSQDSMFLFEDVTIADYDNNPCTLIGSIRMRMSASDDWTVQTLTKFDGIGQFQLQRVFTGVAGQFGADSGSFFSDSAGTGTPPTFNTSSYQWMIDLDGYITVKYGGESVNNTPAGAGDLRIHVPVVPLLSNKQALPGHLSFIDNGSGNYQHYIGRRNSISSVNYLFFSRDGGAVLTPGDLASSDSDFILTVTYKGFQQQV